MIKKRSLLDDEEEEGQNQEDILKVNKGYAKAYQEKKAKEELSWLEDKYKEKLAKKKGNYGFENAKNHKSASNSYSTTEDEEDSESDTEEDEDGELVTPMIDAQILKTLADIRARDAKIYDPQTNFFSAEELAQAEAEWKKKKQESKQKPWTLKDFHRERLLRYSNGEDDDDEEEEEEEGEGEETRLVTKTHNEEQQELLREFKQAAAKTTDSSLEADDLLKMRPKTDAEMAQEEEEYRKFLLENLAASKNAQSSMAEWFGNSPTNRDDGNGGLADDQFLVDYVLNRGWVEKERKQIPTYDQLVKEDEEDAEAVEAQEAFEEKYNFRFEQPGSTTIQTYPRHIEGSLRRTSTKRKEQRASRQARQAEEKERQKEELKRLKNLKHQEIMERLRKIERISGVGSGRAEEALLSDLEEDFDPNVHDRKMQQLFNQDYYQDDGQIEKPIFSDDGLDLDLDGKDEFNQIGVKEARKVLEKAIKEDKKRKKSSQENTNIANIMDEYYQLDYEDMIENIPCRFKYESVAPTTFGLKVRDILDAEDADLNAHVSLKKLAPYRSAEAQSADAEKYATKKRLYRFYDLVKRRRQQRQGETDSSNQKSNQGISQ